VLVDGFIAYEADELELDVAWPFELLPFDVWPFIAEYSTDLGNQ
jgi:hypothetical protein